MKIILLILFLSLITGCAAPLLVVGGMATGAIIADDRRSPGVMLHDENIELTARNAISNDAELREETNINVTSFNFIVLLSGQAPTTILRYRAETLVRNIEHVRLVYNEITIGPPASFATRGSDTLITTRIKGGLFNHKEVNSNHIKIVTESSVVFLMGIVTRAESEQVAEVARSTPGVLKVVRLFEFSN